MKILVEGILDFAKSFLKGKKKIQITLDSKNESVIISTETKKGACRKQAERKLDRLKPVT